MAQDVGAHRRKVYSKAPTVEDELWKRAFWYVTILIIHSVSIKSDLQVSRVLGQDDEHHSRPTLRHPG